MYYILRVNTWPWAAKAEVLGWMKRRVFWR